jgi:hypothetical protein
MQLFLLQKKKSLKNCNFCLRKNFFFYLFYSVLILTDFLVHEYAVMKLEELLSTIVFGKIHLLQGELTFDTFILYYSFVSFYFSYYNYKCWEKSGKLN